jgi:hypothetical protein
VYNKINFVIDLLVDVTIAEMRAARVQRNTNFTTGQIAIGEELFGPALWLNVAATIVQIGKDVARNLSDDGEMSAFGDHIRANMRDQYMSMTNLMCFTNLIIYGTRAHHTD